MKKLLSLSIIIFMIFTLVACGGSTTSAKEGSAEPAAVTTETVDQEKPAEPITAQEFIAQHQGYWIPDYDELDAPKDRLFLIICYDGDKYEVIPASEKKATGTYNYEYIHYLLDTDGKKGETSIVRTFFMCPECKSWSTGEISGTDSYTRSFTCKCEGEPWILGITTDPNQAIEPYEVIGTTESTDTEEAADTAEVSGSDSFDTLYVEMSWNGAVFQEIADKHAEDGDDLMEYIEYYYDFNGKSGEDVPLEVEFKCPKCGAHEQADIMPGDPEQYRVFKCNCTDPAIPNVIGITLDESFLPR